ncbi:NmrA-like family protein [Caulobacter sp. AP07]|uniref:NAD(P)H-binding protein n=1 Tax=Caulobacter sp. AP07 TaxID=1144304 RepID=UPI000271EE1F|nr:NAD(P)H-binding protein [Caulobacter sp. AP07]EJL26016.1 NmrA-like family protein [Caulobacter sp. AP07]
MFAIMEATGATGGAALAELRRCGIRVRALARDPERAAILWTQGVEVVITASDDADALAAAFLGVDAACVMPSPHRPSSAVARAIGQSRLRHVVAISPAGACPDFEDALLATGASVTFVRRLDTAKSGAVGGRTAGRLAARCLMEIRA